MRINQEISLESEIPFQSIYSLRMHWEVNQHAVLELSGRLKNNCKNSDWERNYYRTAVKVFLNGETAAGKEKILFWGVVQTTELIKNHGIGEAGVKAVSTSIVLDEKEVCCTFSDTDKSYSEVARQIARQKSGNVICMIGHKEIEKPLICYKETNWEFLKRIASHQAGCLIPDVKTGKANVWFGMRKGKQIKEEIRLSDTEVEIKKSYTGSGMSRGIKIYMWESRHSYSIGDWTELGGVKYIIYVVDAVLLAGEFLFTYRLAAVGDIRTVICYNEIFTGMSLWGKVEEVKDEKVRVTFDFATEEGKYFYPWKPETGNTLYAVPEAGARVAVYFMNHDEREGIAVRCMGQTEEWEEPEEKIFCLPDENTIQLTDRQMKLQKADQTLSLTDSRKIDISGNQVEINAAGKIRLKAKRILLFGESGIKGVTE